MRKRSYPADSGTYNFTPGPGYAPDVVIVDPDDEPTIVWARVDIRDALTTHRTREAPVVAKATARRERRLADRRLRR